MQNEPREDKSGPRIPPPLGLVRQPAREDPRLDPKVLSAVARIAPGPALRQAVDGIIPSTESAPIGIGEPIADVLAKTNQALATLETYRTRLEQVLTRLTALEFQNAVMLDDVLVTVQRAELTTRMAEEIERACVELGEEGRLIRMQPEELVADVPDEKAALVYDYHADGGAERTREGLEALAALPYDQLLEFELLAVLGYPASVNPLDHSVSPRGYRVLSHIPRLPDAVVKRVVSRLDRLEGIVRASQRELEAVEGVGTVRARELRERLRRLQEHNLVDRYLQI